MAFFQLALKARNLDKLRLKYEEEKLRSLEISKGVKIHYTLGQRIRHKKLLIKKRLKDWCRKITSCPKDSWFHAKGVLLRTDGTIENYVWKSIAGFMGGILLTYLFFMFFVFQLNFTLSSATILCSLFGIMLTLGLAFSYRVRCVVFLLLPQFFSKRGRQALMAYAFILALTGPAKNTLHNMSVLSESLACGQEQLKAAVRTITDLIKRPFYAIKDAIAKVIREIKVVVKKIRQALLAIKRIVLGILKGIKSAFQWLGSIVNICNKKLGTPFERCQQVFEGAIADCRASVGEILAGICNLTYILNGMCYIVKPLDYICKLVDFISDSIIGAFEPNSWYPSEQVILRQYNIEVTEITKFVKHMKAMFYVKVTFSHSFHFETNQSKSLSEVSSGIVTEIRSKTDKFLAVFDWMSLATSLFFMFMFLKVLRYRHRWLTRERYDNHYLTADLREIDLRRTKLDKETVLPLNPRERRKYIPLSSVRLVRSEKISLSKAAVLLCLATFKLGIHMMVDYSLYWVLATIRYHGRFESKVQKPNSVGVFVSGTGYLANLYRSVIRAFSPTGEDVEMDTIPCLPDPIPPDLDRYTQIVSLVAFCWIMAIFEPYGLRLRQLVMIHYHPNRAKQRAVWLYNHIIRSRGNFLKFARRQLRRKFGTVDQSFAERVTCKERMFAICPILDRFFGENKRMCILCGTVEREEEPPLIKCPTPGCVGLFCVQCYVDMQNLCTICLKPIDYGDLSDMSEEKDSSDDQNARSKKAESSTNREPSGEKKRRRDSKKDEPNDERETSTKKEPPATNDDALKRKEPETTSQNEPSGAKKRLTTRNEMSQNDRRNVDADEDPKAKETNSDEEEEDDDAEVFLEEWDKNDQELYASDSGSSSSTVYSYSYQDESPGELDPMEQRAPYKDVEAQKVRDDVTMQIFYSQVTHDQRLRHLYDDYNRGSQRQDNWLLESPARSLRENLASSSSIDSIGETESFFSEDIKEEILEEEQDHISESSELLGKRHDKGTVESKKLIDVVSKPFLETDREHSCSSIGIEKKKSLFERIVNVIRGQQKPSIVTRKVLYNRFDKHDDVEISKPLLSPSSSSSELEIQIELVESCFERSKTSSSDPNRTKLEDNDKQTRKKMNSRRNNDEVINSHRGERSIYVKYPHENVFAVQEVPKYMGSIVRDVKYDEINERDSFSPKGQEFFEKDLDKFEMSTIVEDSEEISAVSCKSLDVAAENGTGELSDEAVDNGMLTSEQKMKRIDKNEYLLPVMPDGNGNRVGIQTQNLVEGQEDALGTLSERQETEWSLSLRKRKSADQRPELDERSRLRMEKIESNTKKQPKDLTNVTKNAKFHDILKTFDFKVAEIEACQTQDHVHCCQLRLGTTACKLKNSLESETFLGVADKQGETETETDAEESLGLIGSGKVRKPRRVARRSRARTKVARRQQSCETSSESEEPSWNKLGNCSRTSRSSGQVQPQIWTKSESSTILGRSVEHRGVQEPRATPSDCYFTDPENPPRRRDSESYRSTLTEDEVTPRRGLTSKNKTSSGRVRRYPFTQTGPRSTDFRKLQPLFRKCQQYKADRNWSSAVDIEPKEDHRAEVETGQIHRYPEEGSRGSSHQYTRYSGGGDSGLTNDDFARESHMRRIISTFEGESNSCMRREASDMFDLTRGRACGFKQQMQLHNSSGSLYDDDNLNSCADNDSQDNYPSEENIVPMYDPLICHCVDKSTKLGSARYPKRYPSPRSYSGQVDPYYGISSSTPRFLASSELIGKLNLSKNSSMVERSSDRAEANVKENSLKPSRNAPVLRKFLPVYQTPELILELKEHDRMKLMKEREDKDVKVCDYTQTVIEDQQVLSVASKVEATEEKSAAPESSEIVSWNSDQRSESMENLLPHMETSSLSNPSEEVERNEDEPEALPKVGSKNQPVRQKKSAVTSRMALRIAKVFGSKVRQS